MLRACGSISGVARATGRVHRRSHRGTALRAREARSRRHHRPKGAQGAGAGVAAGADGAVDRTRDRPSGEGMPSSLVITVEPPKSDPFDTLPTGLQRLVALENAATANR